MGDIIVTENDLKPVQQEVIRQGLALRLNRALFQGLIFQQSR